MKKYLSAVACLVLMVLFCTGVVLLAQPSVGTVLPAASAPDLPVILVDAGHGGFDGGALSWDGKPEKEYNLAIALMLADFLRQDGFRVVLTRSGDDGTQDQSADTIREKKVSDIRNRMQMMDSYENCIFISVHQNYYSDSSCHGAQVFYSGNSPESKEIAERIRAGIVAAAEPDNTRTIKKCDSSVYLMYHATRPAVLLECGFISNYSDAEKLLNPNYQRLLCFAVSEAIYNYIVYPEEKNATESQNRLCMQSLWVRNAEMVRSVPVLLRMEHHGGTAENARFCALRPCVRRQSDTAGYALAD